MDFLQKPSACFPKFYIRVQSKNCRRTSFLIFLFSFFSDFERKFFQTFSQKSSKSCENYLLRVQRNNLWLQNFLKSFEPFWIFYRNLWHGSQFSIYMSRVKIAEKTVFWFFFSEFFRILREKFFRLSATKLQRVVKTTFYVSRGTVCGLKFFSKVLNRFGFSAETFGMVLEILSTCPELKLRKKQFPYFSFQIFFGFWEKNFSDFRPQNFKKLSKLPSTCPEEQFAAWNFF